jgi:succinyl-diaminopimelate desuccinylase
MKNKILDEIVSLTLDLMKCKTIKNEYLEFENAHKIIRKYLQETNYLIKEVEINNYKNLIITNTTSTNLDVIYCGHLDVVLNDTYEGIIKNNKLYGRGSFDMKGQVSVMLSILKNNSTNKKIALILTSDEEIGGECCREILKDYKAEFAVIPDAGRDFTLINEEKGLLQIEVEVRGKKYHSSEPFNGVNAIVEAMNIYNKLIDIYKQPTKVSDYKTSICLSKILGGSSINTVCDKCIMTLDIRNIKDDAVSEILDNIKKINKSVKIKILDQGPVFYTDVNNKYIKEFIDKTKDIVDIKTSFCNATSDAIYFSSKNIPCILINPRGNYWHSKKEYVEIDSLYILYELLKTTF